MMGTEEGLVHTARRHDPDVTFDSCIVGRLSRASKASDVNKAVNSGVHNGRGGQKH